MPLKRLVNPDSIPDPHKELMIYGMSADSRRIRAGYLFAAFSGSQADGLAYLPQAIDKGAVAVLTAPDAPPIETIAHITDPEPRRLFALMASRFYPEQFPDIRPPLAIAVTGTNGKTSVAYFTRHIWTMLGYRAACVGTLGVIAGGFSVASPLTTPSADIIHRILAGLARRGFTHVMLEASSHGLAQHRLDGVKLKAAVFTMLGADHLDYHQNREDYLNAKLRLVREVLPPHSLFVCDDEAPGAQEAQRAARDAGHHIMRVGGRRAEIHLKSCAPSGDGQMLMVSYQGREHRIAFPLIGRFQAVNALLAAACVLGTEANADPAHVFASLETMPPVHGRLEKIARIDKGENKQAAIYIDYAHTADALSAALTALRAALGGGGRLWLIFGAGGDRDQGKRPAMGRIAARLADRVIITDDNPRFENADAIRAAIKTACPKAEDIGDRAEAIRSAVARLEGDDILLIAGKGHEQYQERGGALTPFSDAAIARAAIAEAAG